MPTTTDYLVISIDRVTEGQEDVQRSECRLPLDQVPEMTTEMFNQLLDQLKLQLNIKHE